MDVIAYGIPVMDLLINIDHGLAPNESIDINQTSWQNGGKVSTGLVATKLLCDCECSMAGTTGGMFGCLIRREFERHGIDISHLRHEEDTDSQFCVCLSVLSDSTRNIMVRRSTVPNYTPEEIRAQSAFIQSASYVFFVKFSDEIIITDSFTKVLSVFAGSVGIRFYRRVGEYR